MPELDVEVRALLDRWAATPGTPASELTAAEVRADDLAVLDLQRDPGELHSVADVDATGPAGGVPVRVYRPHPGPLDPILFFHGGGFVIGRDGFSGEKSRWYFDQYLPPGLDRRAPAVSPLYGRSLEHLPRTLIVTAECDPLRDDGEHHAEALHQAGVPVELRRYRGMIHGFFQMTGALERSRRLQRQLGDWMRDATDRHGDHRAGSTHSSLPDGSV
ncbi:alpha/beta hydrolase fold domain-containing protein [Arthrobacter castelli]|uniref:alpha/beta hydrolase fold domain-containing protein n=1 Tax=Arthrobacter castelli TaxID=271431 RepID=UPI0004155619|nr:alpha/beta hydrolase fold domain-containing protein [Arthrobacter castelli]